MTSIRYPLFVCLALSGAVEFSRADDPTDKRPASTKPAEKKPAEKKPAEKKPAEKKPAENKPADAESDDAAKAKLAGHSYHGDAFNTGPRQQAYLMESTSNVHFPVTTKNPLVQKFIDQGVGQLHGFWYFEAERSFRQAAALDPDCAIAYWGMASANANNAKRSKTFIEEASKRKSKASAREVMYIDALHKFLNTDRKKNKERYQALTKAYEDICFAHEDDLEAKAQLCLTLYNGRRAGSAISSHLALDALMRDVLDENPMHPIHHYRIHLWDYKKPARALDSTILCGQSAPGIAHMWHMPGHIFSRLKRYQDACWQQEASARVDHAHMMRDRVLPDQIHNFAHNNEWLVRNLIHVGRVKDAYDLARNMIELPRHPRYNTPKKRGGSAAYGRARLFDVLVKYERWDDLVKLSDTMYLAPTTVENEQIKRLRMLGQACFRKGDITRGEQQLEALRARLATITSEEQAAVDKAQAAIINKAVKEHQAKHKKQGQPQDKPKTPTDKPKTPADKPKTPADKPKTPADKPKTPADKPKTPADKPKTPADKPKTPADKPKTPADKPKTPADKPKTPADKPQDAQPDKAAQPNDKQQSQPGEQKDSTPDKKQDTSPETKADANADEKQKAEAAQRRKQEQQIRETVKKQKTKQLDKARKDATKPFASRKREVQRAVDAVEGHRHVAADRIAEGLKSFKKSGGVSPLYLAQLQARSGQAEEAVKALQKQVEQHKNEVLPLVALVTTRWELGQHKDAQKSFEALRSLSGPMQLDSPIFERLQPIAKELGWPDDWRVASQAADDVGQRPDLDTLGPFRWQPSTAPQWTLRDVDDQQHRLSQYRGRPLVVIFYLGYGCLHCAEQLQAFAPQTEAFAKAGIDLIAISTDDMEGLKDSHKGYEKGSFPFPLISDSDLSVFKAYRAYDDFEKQPLHGTFLIDKQGQVRWQDISYEPFMDHAFVLREAKRLLPSCD